jgi:MoCo/4Fe-4S cofactor protein with predicted Tat translocation signal
MTTHSNQSDSAIDFEVVRAALAKAGGRRFWQSLEELSDTKEYRNFLENEFPANAEKKPFEVNRREMLKLMAASLAVAGFSGCTKLPTEKIVPYVMPPEEIIPGRPLYYATSMSLAGVATGLLVESNMGRPTKIEGNPDHPGSLGGTDVFTQASVLNLYDPDRSQAVIHEGRVSDWPAFVDAIDIARLKLSPKGTGLRILTETITSPTLAAQIRQVLTQFPEAKWHQYEPCSGDPLREGTRLAFGKPVNPVYRIDQAQVIVSLDSDFLTSGPGHVRYAREFSSRRALKGPSSSLNRLYVLESMPTSTGAMADHRLPVRANQVQNLARKLAAGIGISANNSSPAANANNGLDVWISAVARDLQGNRGTCLVIAGEEQPPAVHVLAQAMNHALGCVGKTVYYTERLEANPVNELESLRELVGDLNAGKVELLVILGGNPVYNAPADFDFGSALLRATLRVHTGLHYDETAELCHWHAPGTHYLETWSDSRAYDGTIGIVQPLIAPLYGGRSVHEIVSILSGTADASGHDLVHQYWQRQGLEKGSPFEAFWETTLHDGLMARTALPPISVSLRPDSIDQTAGGAAGEDPTQLELVLRPDPAVGDGQFANNAWLQELPKPITRLTWDNAAMVGLGTAERLGVKQGDYVKLQAGGRTTFAGIVVVPGHVENSVTLHLGYGRRRAGRMGTGFGFDAYPLRTSAEPWMTTGLRLENTGKKYYFADVQHQYIVDHDGHSADEEGLASITRNMVQVATLEEFRQNPDFARTRDQQATENLTLYPGFKHQGYAWGMSIDLNRCVGCNACVIACQSENNIAVVGKDQVMRGRAMHWIRIDTYFRGPFENPEIYYEPLPCMQCENAPCELVCPVGATTHSPEGLNEMTYNRCVGTRYCSNNCPYKVRRFNFLLYSDWDTPSLYGVRNPNVTVRSRGVMEKCTYCVQRINEAKIRSEEEMRSVRDGEIVTACQGACPADAIVFGNINDSNSRVAKLKAESRNYTLLEDLNTRPRTTYLARVRNPNPEIRD